MPKRPAPSRPVHALPIVEAASPNTEVETGKSRRLPICLILFAGSGCAALIYEIVWFQLLQLVIGSSAVSLGLLLAMYMGGLCIGSLALPRFVPASVHSLRVYAALELGIGVFGIVALFGVPLLGHIYAVAAMPGLVVRGLVAAVCLVPPTILMGASLPAISRWVESTPRGISWMGLLYSANIAGAVIGCLGAGFYLLRVYDMGVATYAAAAINFAAAAGAWMLTGAGDRLASPAAAEVRESADERSRSAAPFVYAAIGLSGLTALGAEVIWTRLLSLLLGATVYTFSIILAVFLIGLWAGSGVGSYWSRRTKEPRLALATCQWLLALAIGWTAYFVAKVLPYWPVDPSLSTSPWFTFDLDITRCVHAILPAAFLWGASFPLALAAAVAKGEDPAQLTGRVYAANTAGSIIGALVFSLVLIQAIGTKGSEEVLIWGGAIASAAAAAAATAPRRYLALVGALALVLTLPWLVPGVPWQAIAYGRRSAFILHASEVATAETAAEPLFVGEGLNSSVVISQRADQRFFYVSGKSEASTAILDMRLQRMMGHLPALFHSGPQSVLVVGFGAGVTAGSFVPYPHVKKIAICELEPMIPPASDEYFGKENYNVLRDPRTRIVYDDARHYIFTAPEKFDVITTDPIHPWVKGTSTLYSKEYYELVKSHLNLGGVVAQWLPLYESDDETVKTELATFFSVFPAATIWGNYLNGDGYDLVLIGRNQDSPINVDQLQQRLNRQDYARVAMSLADVDINSASDLLATYVGRAPDLQTFVGNVPINDDLNLRLQYLAGLGLNSAAGPRLYNELLSQRTFPEGLIAGSGEAIEKLRTVFGRPHRTF